MQKLTREEKIILEIQNNPGIRFRELMKMIGITNGILSYYITKLEKNRHSSCTKEIWCFKILYA